MVKFSENQTIILTNKCNLSCKGCIVFDKETSHNIDFFNQKLVELLVNNNVKNVRLSGGEVFLEYEKLINFVKILKDKDINLSEIFTNSYSEQNGETDNFLNVLNDLDYNPIFNLSIDDMHPQNVEQNISLINKLKYFGTKKIVINSSSFTKEIGKNLETFLSRLKEIEAKKIDDTQLYKKYILGDLEIIINIKGMYKVDNFEENRLDIPDNFWNFPITTDNFIRAIGYNAIAYNSETFAYTGIDFGYEIVEENNILKIGDFKNKRLLEYTNKKPLIKLFEILKKKYPDLKKEYFNVGDEFLIWILKQKINLDKIL